MLDDTYYLHNGSTSLREFLTLARADDEADSYSLFIKDSFMMYSSNRITKSNKSLRYIYRLHEVIQNNNNFELPNGYCHITDEKSDYMTERTMTRKQEDLVILLEEMRDDPDNPRHLYYIAETYICLKDWSNAFKYYELRILHPSVGFSQEIQDSLYKRAVIAHFNIRLDWSEVQSLYLKCYEYDKTRVESLYMIGYHYVTESSESSKISDENEAYKYLTQAYDISVSFKPSTMNSKHLINMYEIPRLLVPLCYPHKNWQLGFDCAKRCHEYEQANMPKEQSNMIFWMSMYYLCAESQKYNIGNKNKIVYKNNQHVLTPPNDTISIHKRLEQYGPLISTHEIGALKTIVFVSSGGWNTWDGETLTAKGLGGSETWLIKYAEYIHLMYSDKYQVIIFCNTPQLERVYKGVNYIDINTFPQFIATHTVDWCFVSRYPEYLQVCIENNIPNIYLVLHDLLRYKEIIPVSDLIKGIICLSNWHIDNVAEQFGQFRHKMSAISYGVDKSDLDMYALTSRTKTPYSFIYPSFPHRGLIPLLQMFPYIRARYPTATLNIFCDTKLQYLQQNCKEYVDIVDKLINDLNIHGVTNHGWVSESTLKKWWSTSHIWLYPCTFRETFCRVALEAAASRTLVITSGLASLAETAKHGITIQGDPSTDGWQSTALEKLFSILDEPSLAEMNKSIENNYRWAQSVTYENVVSNFIEKYT